jgi:hypothetical protein
MGTAQVLPPRPSVTSYTPPEPPPFQLSATETLAAIAAFKDYEVRLAVSCADWNRSQWVATRAYSTEFRYMNAGHPGSRGIPFYAAGAPMNLHMFRLSLKRPHVREALLAHFLRLQYDLVVNLDDDELVLTPRCADSVACRAAEINELYTVVYKALRFWQTMMDSVHQTDAFKLDRSPIEFVHPTRYYLSVLFSLSPDRDTAILKFEGQYSVPELEPLRVKLEAVGFVIESVDERPRTLSISGLSRVVVNTCITIRPVGLITVLVSRTK